jgi:hypothetical protein
LTFLAVVVRRVQRRQYVARGVGSLFMWWGIQGGFLVGAIGALWFGTFVGGAIAAAGDARTGFDGVYEALVALAVVVAIAGPGLVVWLVLTHGLGVFGLVDDAVRVLLLVVHVRQVFLLPVVLGGATGGLLNGWLGGR